MVLSQLSRKGKAHRTVLHNHPASPVGCKFDDCRWPCPNWRKSPYLQTYIYSLALQKLGTCSKSLAEVMHANRNRIFIHLWNQSRKSMNHLLRRWLRLGFRSSLALFLQLANSTTQIVSQSYLYHSRLFWMTLSCDRLANSYDLGIQFTIQGQQHNLARWNHLQSHTMCKVHCKALEWSRFVDNSNLHLWLRHKCHDLISCRGSTSIARGPLEMV